MNETERYPANLPDRCGCGDEECGFAWVADRRDRWAAAGYVGDWQDPEYDPTEKE